MSWTAKVTSKDKDASHNVVVTVQFTNDTTGDTITRTDYRGVDITDASIAAWAKIVIKNVLEVADATFDAVTIGDVVLPPDPSAEEVAAKEAQIAAKAALGKLQLAKQKVDLGILSATDQEYVDALAEAKDAAVAEVAIKAPMEVLKS